MKFYFTVKQRKWKEINTGKRPGRGRALTCIWGPACIYACNLLWDELWVFVSLWGCFLFFIYFLSQCVVWAQVSSNMIGQTPQGQTHLFYRSLGLRFIKLTRCNYTWWRWDWMKQNKADTKSWKKADSRKEELFFLFYLASCVSLSLSLPYCFCFLSLFLLSRTARERVERGNLSLWLEIFKEITIEEEN